MILQNLLFGCNWTTFVNGFSNDIHDPTQGLWAHWDPDRGSCVEDFLTADQTLCTIHSNGPDCVFTWRDTWERTHSSHSRYPNTDLLSSVKTSGLLPRCCATSSTSLLSRPATSSALRMGGRPSSNWTSTTAPITATIRPLASAAWAAGAV